MAKWKDNSTRWTKSQMLKLTNFELGVYARNGGGFAAFLLCQYPREFLFRDRGINALCMEQAKSLAMQEAKEALTVLEGRCARAMAEMRPLESVKLKVTARRKGAG